MASYVMASGIVKLLPVAHKLCIKQNFKTSQTDSDELNMPVVEIRVTNW